MLVLKVPSLKEKVAAKYQTKVYHYQNATKLSDSSVILWAEDQNSVEGYGRYGFVLDSFKCDIHDAFMAIYNKFSDNPYDMYEGIRDTEKYWEDEVFNWDSFKEDLDPENIVDTAGWWDDPDFIGWFSTHFADEEKFQCIKTSDGAVTLDPKFGRRFI